MNTYHATLYFQNIPIWSDIVYSNEPPDILALNKKFNMFGDELIVRQITNTRVLAPIRHKQFVTIWLTKFIKSIDAFGVKILKF